MLKKNIMSQNKNFYKISDDSINKMLIALIFPSAIIMLFYSLFRRFDIDEMEALNTSWKIFKGEKLYVDIIQNHNPLLYYLIVPIFKIFGPTGMAFRFIRFLMYLFFLLTTWSTYYLCKILTNKTTALISVIAVWSIPIFCIHGIEIRPDIPQISFSIIAVTLFFSYLKTKNDLHVFLSALSLGISFLFLQKAIFLIVLFSLLAMYHTIIGNINLIIFFICILIFLTPETLYVFYHFIQGTFSYYLMSNYFNLAYNHNKIFINNILIDTIDYIYKSNPFIWLFYSLGFLSSFNKKNLSQICFLSLGLILSLLIYPVQYRWYLIPALPFVAIVSSQFLYMILKIDYKTLIIILLIMLLPTMTCFITRRMIISPNSVQINKIEYIKSITQKDDHILDSQLTYDSFNIFWKPIHHYWFDTNTFLGLEEIITGKKPHFEAIEQIKKYKPKIMTKHSLKTLSGKEFEQINDEFITQNYFIDSVYPDLLVLK